MIVDELEVNIGDETTPYEGTTKKIIHESL